MKKILVGLFTLMTIFVYGQRVELFADSLALDLRRTWIDINGSEFTELGQNCNFGMEITFVKDSNQVMFHQCDEGEWKQFDYRYEVISMDGEHFIELYDNDMKLEHYEIEAQFVADDQENFITELTLFSYMDKRSYTLRSKK